MQSLCDGEPHKRTILSGYSPFPSTDSRDLGLLGKVREGVELADPDRRMRQKVRTLLQPVPSLRECYHKGYTPFSS